MPEITLSTEKLIKNYLRTRKKSGSSESTPENYKEFLTSYAYSSTRNIISIGENIKEEEKERLLLSAIQKAFFGLNPSSNTYKEAPLKERLFKKLFGFFKSRKTPYFLIADIISKNPEKAKSLLEDPEKAEKEISKSYKEAVTKIQKHLLQDITHKTLILFVVLLFLFAVLAELFSPIALINLVTPLSLMLLLSLFVKTPPEKNRKKMTLQIFKIIYKKEKPNTDRINFFVGKQPFLYLAVSLFYIICFFLLASAITWALVFLGNPPLHSLLLILSLSFVSFTGIRIREKMREFYTVKREESFFDVIIEIFSLPLVWMEKCKPLLSSPKVRPSFSKRRPSKKHSFSETLQGWRNSLKRKKDNYYKN